jgi:hypothetical protein
MSDKPFDAEACVIGGQASATNGLSDMKTPSKTHRVIDPLYVTLNIFHVHLPQINASALKWKPYEPTAKERRQAEQIKKSQEERQKKR